MSGFLHRVASGVLRTDSTLHPAVGTMWSAPPDIAGLESAEEVAVPMPQRDTEAHQPIPGERRAGPTVREDGADSATGQRSQRGIADETKVFTPLVAMHPWSGDAMRGEMFSEGTAAESEDVADGNRERRWHEAAERQMGVMDESSRASAMQPVSTARTVTEAGETLSPAMPMRPAQAGLQRPLQADAQRQDAQRQGSEPDTIEIHIGRIEVLAAPPRPARPAAPEPARKSLDLGEYLRGGRRAR